MTTKKAYLFAGPPGGGKSTAAEIGKTLTNGGKITAGNLIREMAERAGMEDPTSHELGQFAARKREDLGDGYFGDIVSKRLSSGQMVTDYPCFVDSVRHAKGVQNFRAFFDPAPVVWVGASREERLDRLKDRGREGEESFTIEDLRERDLREMNELGTQTIIDEGLIDHVIHNNATQRKLNQEMEFVIENGPIACQ